MLFRSVQVLTATLDGKIGIKTTTPAANLHVTGNAYVSANIVSGNYATGEILFANNGIMLNSNVISSNVIMATGVNGFSVGPITINSGVNVTVATGNRWVIY